MLMNKNLTIFKIIFFKGINLIKQKHDYIQHVESCYLSNYERVDLNFNLVKVLHLWAQEKVFIIFLRVLVYFPEI